MVENNFSSNDSDPVAWILQSSAERTRQAKSHWHSLERASKRKSYESVRAQCMRANHPPFSDASVIMEHITSGYERHVSSVRGWHQAGSESDNRTYECHIPRLKPICNTLASDYSQHIPPSHSYYSFPSSPASLALSGYRCVNPQTLPLWSPYWTHRAQQRLAHSLESSWPKRSCTHSYHLLDCVRQIQRCHS